MKTQVFYQQLPVYIYVRVVLFEAYLAIKSVPVVKVRHNAVDRAIKLISVVVFVSLM